MKNRNIFSHIRYIFISIFLLYFIVPVSTFGANPAVVNLGTADNFAVLAGSTITGPGTITGDLGLSPGAFVTGFPPGIVTGTQHVADVTAVLAQTHLTTAYNIASSQTPVSTVVTELGGTTKFAGIYNSSDGTFGITGTLTLDAQGDPGAVFIFKTNSTLTTAGASNINLINGAQACNVFWIIGSSATLGTSSHFKGNILALTSITATTSANVDGRLLARNGAVTLDGNTIIKATCLIPPSTASLHLIKVVVNGTGGTAIPSQFNLHVKSFGVDVIGSPLSGTGSPGSLYTLGAGTYDVSEDTDTSYTSNFSGACSPSGSVTLTGGDNKTCTVTNTYNPPIVLPVSGGGGSSYTPSSIPIVTLSSTSSLIISPTVSGNMLPLPLPRIHITKVPSQLTPFTFGGGNVTYVYTVTNPTLVPLHSVTVTDDKCSPVTYVFSGDTNNNKLLDHGEIWTYKCQSHITVTTKNTAVAAGRGNGHTAFSYATANVMVGTPTFPNTGSYFEEKTTLLQLMVFTSIYILLISGSILFLKRINI